MEVIEIPFGNLLARDLSKIQADAQSISGRTHILDALSNYLEGWVNSDWKDTEKIYFIGYDLGRVWPTAHKGDLSALPVLARDLSVKEAFASGLEHAVSKGCTEEPAASSKKYVHAKYKLYKNDESHVGAVIASVISSVRSIFR